MSHRALIVDDDHAIARLASIWLNSAGFETRLAYDGESALITARAWQPDVVLLDIRMPGIDGFEVFAMMKDDPMLAGIPVIYLSANAQESARREAMASGAAAFIAKPFEPGEVLRAVRRELASPSHPTEQESAS